MKSGRPSIFTDNMNETIFTMRESGKTSDEIAAALNLYNGKQIKDHICYLRRTGEKISRLPPGTKKDGKIHHYKKREQI
jgi:SOS-response transcriptional repressor LexA